MRWGIFLFLLATVADGIPPDERPPVRGMYSRLHKRSTDEYDHKIVFPRRVTNEGNLISHNVTHYHGDGDKEMLHLQIAMKGLEYHLQLKPVVNFISSTLVIERWSSTSKIREQLDNTNCHFEGSVRGHPNSHVSISTCNGLVGVLHVDNGVLWVEPVEEIGENIARLGKHVESALSRPHLVFRRSASMMGTGGQQETLSEGTCETADPPRTQDYEQGHGQHRQRVRRSYSQARYIETLVVADPDVTKYYANLDVKTYLLTIFNMAAAIIRHPSIGNDINIVIVHMILMDRTDPNLNISSNVDNTLKQFCHWTERFKQINDIPHHDFAVLITRQEFCSRRKNNILSCNTVGLAYVPGMCLPNQSCSVTRDSGISLAYTIAHELAHSLKAYHDDRQAGCESNDSRHIMLPVLSHDILIGEPWSSCTRRDIINFFDGGGGWCLNNKPSIKEEYQFTHLQHGVVYDASRQCEIAHNVTSSYVCDQSNICGELWCYVNNSCNSLMTPAAPGTNCGHHKWCQEKKCVPMNEPPEPINGDWGEWGPWSECSNSCGKGITLQMRQCDHPLPTNGGKYCIGERRRLKICHGIDCLSPRFKKAENFKVDHCTRQQNKLMPNEKNNTYLPSVAIDEPCVLYCTDNNTHFRHYDLDILNGEPCESNGFCVAGLCYKYGCDDIIGSNMTLDKCGICGGDGTQCKAVSDTFKIVHAKSGYHFAFMIPSGARNIVLREVGEFSPNLAICSRKNPNLYYYNGNLNYNFAENVTKKEIIKIAGASAEVDVYRLREKISILNPINEDINVYFYVGHAEEESLCWVSFNYILPLTNSNIHHEYSWVHGEPSPCSATCGHGIKSYPVVCKERNRGNVVEDKYCSSELKLEPKNVNCNIQECPSRWWTGDWQPCSGICEKRQRTRSVLCITGTLAAPDVNCNSTTKPSEVAPCDDMPSLCGHNNERYTINNGNNGGEGSNEETEIRKLHNTVGSFESRNSVFRRQKSRDNCTYRKKNNQTASTIMCQGRKRVIEQMSSPKRNLSICTDQMSSDDFKICKRNKRRRHRSHSCMQRWCSNGKTGCKNGAGKCIFDRKFCNSLKSAKKCCPKCTRRRRHDRPSPNKKFTTREFS